MRLAATETSTTKAVGDLAALVDDGMGRYMASPNDASPALFDGRRRARLEGRPVVRFRTRALLTLAEIQPSLRGDSCDRDRSVRNPARPSVR